ncbi:GntR family transcriptional regulator [Leifsonia shinshuensis]|uniref:DNA-binding transcriptional regulator YhcF (GntR family) n=1 Tax=Leifsonia shinshuensis TaxID=150026 RepID=A0A853CW90_9MICO|nr:DNA-binding transcriptional regulator YhcF (GntR family) [Leifsonia shinshuensis]
MRIELDPTAETPLYQQLHDRVIDAIARGELREGDALVSVRQLAVRFGINAATVVKAYDALRQEGIVRTSRRSGSVVARDPESGPPEERFLADWSERLSALVAEGIAHGVPPAELEARTAAIASSFARVREQNRAEGRPLAGDPKGNTP